MSHTLAPADVSHYYQRLAELSTLPFWQREEFTEPAGPERGHVWHWHDVYPELARSRQFAADASDLQRRALILRNPGLTAPTAGATPTIAAAYQMLFPGEKAPVHAHSTSAIRFGLAGSGARMIIDGDRVPMEPGDLILTPSWSWHGHVHPGGDESVVWMDGLDVPFVLGLRAGFIRDDPYSGNPLPVRDTTGTAAGTAGTAALLPAGTQRTAQPGPPLPVGRGLPGPPAADGPVSRAQDPHQPGVPQPAHRRPRPGHPGLPARGPARRRPDPAAPGNRQLGHRGGPRHRDAHLRRPDLRALA